jgi:hypothetical protein
MAHGACGNEITQCINLPAPPYSWDDRHATGHFQPERVKVMKSVRSHRTSDGEVFIPPVKTLNGTADHQVNDTVENKPNCPFFSVFREKYYCAVEKTVSKKWLRDKDSAFSRYLVLGIDTEYVRILAHMTT